MQVELEPEDSVTCQWEDCGVVFTHLPTLIDHIHNGELNSSSEILIEQRTTNNTTFVSCRTYWRPQVQLYM